MSYAISEATLNHNVKSLIKKATSASSDPVPGYIYNEISNVISRDLSIVSGIEDYALAKLCRKEPYVKYKCLKLLKYLCSNYPQQVSIIKISNSNQVTECRSYRAPYSEYEGEYLSKLVRTEIEDLFATIDERSMSPGKSEVTGFGNTPSYVQKTSKMEGFGNYVPPPPKSKRNETLKMISNVANKYIPSSVMSKIELVGSAIASTAKEQLEKHVGPLRSRGKLQQQGYRTNWRQEEWITEQPPVNSQPEPSEGYGMAESRLVSEILTFSGVKITPSKEITQEFVAKMNQLNAELVVGELLRRLNTRDSDWQCQLRILCLLETLLTLQALKPNIVRGIKPNLTHILTKLKESTKLKSKAERILELLDRVRGQMDSSTKADKVGDDLYNLIGTPGSSSDIFGTREKDGKNLDGKMSGGKIIDGNMFDDHMFGASQKQEPEASSSSANKGPDFDMLLLDDSKGDVRSTFDPFAEAEQPTNPIAKSKPKDDFDFIEEALNAM